MLDLILTVLLAIAALVGLGGSVWSYRKGKSDAETKQEIDQHNEYIATRKRIEAALSAADPDAIRDSLRNRDPNKR